MAYEDAPVSDAHRKALEAGRKMFESKDGLTIPRPGLLKRVIRSRISSLRLASKNAWA